MPTLDGSIPIVRNVKKQEEFPALTSGYLPKSVKQEIKNLAKTAKALQNKINTETVNKSRSATFSLVNTQYYPQEIIYVLGGGPSLKDFDFNRLKDKFVIGCNDAYKLGNEIVDILFFGDKGWFEKHHERVVSTFDGLVISTNGVINKEKNRRFKQVRQIRNGLSNDPTVVAWNTNSGAAALNVALLLGARVVVLLGFDMKLDPTDGQANWHVNEVGPPRKESYFRMLRNFKVVRDDMIKFPDSIVINANPDSMLEFFPKMTIDAALEKY